MPISEKQKEILLFPYEDYDAIICDGAIRSGKTMFMSLSFCLWAMDNFNHQKFAIAGKTVNSAIENIIKPLIALSYLRQNFVVKWRGGDKMLILKRGNKENAFEVFGGKDESSYMLIQGRTFAGVLLDEVALMPQSFVDQATGRCSVEGAKLWFNCNPESPSHWFYSEWIQKLGKHNAKRIHFQLEDNPSLSKKKIDFYKSNYSGIFYQRYILGEWVMTDGLVYRFTENMITDDSPEDGELFLSVDYGTLNPFSAGLWNVSGGRAVRIAEYYHDGRETQIQYTDEKYCDELEKFIDGREIKKIIVDPSAASFIAAMRKKGYRMVKAENDVINGIRFTAACLENGIIKINRKCTNSIKEFGLYSWDVKATEDKVVKENDHAMDDIRYFCATIMRHKARVNGHELLWENKGE